MAYEKVGSGGNAAVEDNRETVYPKYKDLNEAGVSEDGIIIAEGIFTGEYTGNGKFGEFTNYYVDAGEHKICLAKAGNLGYLINKADLVRGVSKIRVTYFGKLPMKAGERAGTPAHTFELEVDKA